MVTRGLNWQQSGRILLRAVSNEWRCTVSTILVDNPTMQTKEEWLKFRFDGPGDNGKDVAVVSGYASYHQDQIRGSDESDYADVPYEVTLWVGPKWRELNDVSPTAHLAGFAAYEADEAQMTGMEIHECRWEFPDPNPTQQIRLIIKLVMMGGEHAYLTVLGYHLTARGWLMPNQDFEEIDS
jgi:hypothetical protein